MKEETLYGIAAPILIMLATSRVINSNSDLPQPHDPISISAASGVLFGIAILATILAVILHSKNL